MTLNTNITVLPLTDKSLRDIWEEAAAMEILSATSQFGVGFKKLSPDAFQLAVEDVEMGMSDKLTLASHRQELTAPP